jgi:hypothetical protein
MSESNLKWLPLPLNLRTEAGSIGPPPGLTDFQVGWFWNLFWTSLANPEFPGYLPAARSTLWTFAGAHRRAHWDANCTLVMAAFELREIAGRKMLCLPALVNIIEEQQKKLSSHRKRVDFRISHSVPHECGDSSPSQSTFDFELQNQRGQQDGRTGYATTGVPASQFAQGKRSRRVQQTRDVLRESLRRYGG